MDAAAVAEVLPGARVRASAPARAALWCAAMATRAPDRIGVLDTDTGFVHVLAKRLDAAGIAHRVIAVPPSVDVLVTLRLTALIVDPVVLGPSAWTYVETIAAKMPSLGLIVCTAPSAVAQRVRGLRLGADDWVSKPCHPEEVVARLEAVVRRRSLHDPRADQAPLSVGGLAVRPDRFQAFAGEVSADLTRREFELIQLLAEREGQVLAARGDLRARVGLRDGPRRPLGRRVRAQAAPEAREGLAGLALHPHALRDRLSLRGRARRRRRRPGRRAGRQDVLLSA